MSTYRVILPDGSMTSIVEPDFSAAHYMADLRWPGSTVVDPREYRQFTGEREGAFPQAIPPLRSPVLSLDELLEMDGFDGLTPKAARSARSDWAKRPLRSAA